jgi:hypothetical protein
MTAAAGESCTWCGATVEPSNGFRAHQPAVQRYAVFCRLEHLVPWELQGSVWLPAPAENPGIPGRGTEEMPGSDSEEVPGSDSEEMPGSDFCSHCGAALEETAVLLVRHRDEHRIADGFCSAAHMAAWARAGGRWQ